MAWTYCSRARYGNRPSDGAWASRDPDAVRVVLDSAADAIEICPLVLVDFLGRFGIAFATDSCACARKARVVHSIQPKVS